MIEPRVGRLVWRVRLRWGQCVPSALGRRSCVLIDPLRHQSNTTTTKCGLVPALRNFWRRSWSEPDCGQTIKYRVSFPSTTLALILWGQSYHTANLWRRKALFAIIIKQWRWKWCHFIAKGTLQPDISVLGNNQPSAVKLINVKINVPPIFTPFFIVSIVRNLDLIGLKIPTE